MAKHPNPEKLSDEIFWLDDWPKYIASHTVQAQLSLHRHIVALSKTYNLTPSVTFALLAEQMSVLARSCIAGERYESAEQIPQPENWIPPKDT